MVMHPCFVKAAGLLMPSCCQWGFWSVFIHFDYGDKVQGRFALNIMRFMQISPHRALWLCMSRFRLSQWSWPGFAVISGAAFPIIDHWFGHRYVDALCACRNFIFWNCSNMIRAGVGSDRSPFSVSTFVANSDCERHWRYASAYRFIWRGK
jgi:hypothetical protein